MVKLVSLIMIIPALVWSSTALYNIVRDGIYSNTSLFPFSFRVHAFSLLNMAVFYIITFLIILPHRPLKNFSRSLALLFLSNSSYELIYGIMYDWTSLGATLPLTIVSILVLLLLNRRFHFLANGKKNLLWLVACFTILITIMLTLNQMGFFTEMRLYLTGQSMNDPHNLLWIISKFLSVWMFFPLVNAKSNRIH